jgi:uncharacterized membrane protein (UPF0127 family)
MVLRSRAVAELYHDATMRRRIAACSALVILCIATACTSGASSTTATPAGTSTPTVVPVSFPTAELHILQAGGDRVLRIEVATTPAQSERGLGYRDALAPDAGMLFDLGSTRNPSFWMKGMRFALDFVWISEDQRVAAVTTDVPRQPGAPDAQLHLYSSPGPVRYVLEINAGASARLGITAGTQLSFDTPE